MRRYTLASAYRKTTRRKKFARLGIANSETSTRLKEQTERGFTYGLATQEDMTSRELILLEKELELEKDKWLDGQKSEPE